MLIHPIATAGTIAVLALVVAVIGWTVNGALPAILEALRGPAER